MKEVIAVRLPQEVLDIIINNLDPRADIQTLKQCALAARCLVPAAQRMLFHKVCFNCGTTYKPDRYLSFLKHSPHLAEYITELELHIETHPNPPWGDDPSRHPLASILPRLQSLKKVSIQATYGKPTATSLQISTLLGGAAMPKIRSFTLRHIPMTMQEIFAMCDWLAAHGGLQELHFIRILEADLISPSIPPQAVSSHVPTQLHRFTIEHDSTLVEALLRWATGSTSLLFNALRELTVGTLTQQSSVYLLRILDMAKNTLSCLRFTGETPSLSSFQFNTYHNLRHIFCYFKYLGNSAIPATLNEWCIALKESRELKLESFDVSFWWDCPLRHDYPWNELEEVLISGGRCARFVLRILYTSTRTDTNTIRERFPQLHASDACDLVMINTVDEFNILNPVSWEYTPRSGEWKRVAHDDDDDYF